MNFRTATSALSLARTTFTKTKVLWLAVTLVCCFFPEIASAQRWRLPRSQGRNGSAVRAAFEETTALARQSTVEIRGARGTIALGIVVRDDGWIATKASELTDSSQCRASTGGLLPILEKIVVEEHDLAFLRIDLPNAKAIAWSDTPQLDPGAWVVSPSLGEQPLAVGVIGVGPRSIAPRTGFLGVEMETLSDPPGVRITRVLRDTAASRAGLRVGDVVLEANKTKTETRRQLSSAIRSLRPGQVIALDVQRQDQRVTLQAKLGQRNPDPSDFEYAAPVSLRHSGFPSAFQHDSRLDPDECGGAVVDLSGKAVGINIARASRTECYALPATLVQELIREKLPTHKKKPKYQ